MKNKPNCPLCNHDDISSYGYIEGAKFARCNACGSIFSLSGPPSDTYYSEKYHQERGHFDERSITECKRKTFEGFLKLLGEFSPGSKILEIGSATGHALKVAKELGFDPIGVELSQTAVQQARALVPDVKIYATRLEQIDLPDGLFRYAALFDVIEHIDKPHEFFGKINRLMETDGKIIVVTPDIGSLSARISGRGWVHLMAEHVILYSRNSIVDLLNKHGFETERLMVAPKYICAQMALRHATIHPEILGGRLIRILLGRMPATMLDRPIKFNLGEMAIVARKTS